MLTVLMQTVLAVNPDSAYIERYSLWRGTFGQSLQNPALMTRAYMKSHTQLNVQCDYRHQGEVIPDC